MNRKRTLGHSIGGPRVNKGMRQSETGMRHNESSCNLILVSRSGLPVLAERGLE